MLTEIKGVRQFEGEPRRRWFDDQYFELIVWAEHDGRIVGFQLCYDVRHDERALTWWEGVGYSHNRIDEGEDRPGKHKSTPLVMKDGAFDRNLIAARFDEASREIDREVVALVAEELKLYE